MMTKIIERAWPLMRRLSALLLFPLAFLSAHADTFILFKNGQLRVFPDESVIEVKKTPRNIFVTAIDGTAYTYSLADVQNVGQELPREIPVMASFLFDNKYNHQVVTDAVGVFYGDSITASVAGIGKRLTASFQLSDQGARAWVDGVEQHSDVSRLRFDTCRVYLVGYPGDLVLKADTAGACSWQQYGREYRVTADFLTDHADRVPRIDINTVGGENISSKEYYLDAEIIIDGAGVFPSMTDSVQVKGRGNTTWSSNPDSKNPYRLKFKSKKKPLGLTKGKNWVLLANKRIGSMLTNAYGMKAASLIGTVAANHIIPVDLYVNGVYKGHYNFTEKVGLSNNSVSLDDETAAALLELDTHYDEPVGQKFYSSPYTIPVNIKKPEFADTASTVLTFSIVRTRFNQLAKAAYYGTDDLTDYLDVDNIARYLMLNEYIYNYEINMPKSVFCYNEDMLDPNSKFMFGPAWDFDWAFGYSTNRNYYFCDPMTDFYQALQPAHYKFFYNMHRDPQVARHMLELWDAFIANGLDELCEYCEEYYEYAKPSFLNNKALGIDNTKYDNQPARAADWFRRRAMAIRVQLAAELALPGDVNGDGVVNIDDVTLLIDYLLGGETGNGLAQGADVDGDGNVGIDDVTALIDLLLGGNDL